MKSLTLRMALALVAALAIAACSDDSPTSPTANTLDPSAGDSGTVGALDKRGTGDCQPKPHNSHCHGGDPGGEDPPPAVYMVSAMGDINIDGMAGGKGGSVNLRREGSTLSFSDLFIGQMFDNGASGINCFGDPPQPHSQTFLGGIMNPKTRVANADAGVQLYFTALKDDGVTPVEYQIQAEVQCGGCSFPPTTGEMVTMTWMDTANLSVNRSGKAGTCISDDLNQIAGTVEVTGQ